MLWIQGLTAEKLLQGRGEMTVKPAVIEILLNKCALDKGTDCNVVCTG